MKKTKLSVRTAVICSTLNEDIVGVSHKSDAALIRTALPVGECIDRSIELKGDTTDAARPTI